MICLSSAIYPRSPQRCWASFYSFPKEVKSFDLMYKLDGSSHHPSTRGRLFFEVRDLARTILARYLANIQFRVWILASKPLTSFRKTHADTRGGPSLVSMGVADPHISSLARRGRGGLKVSYSGYAQGPRSSCLFTTEQRRPITAETLRQNTVPK